MIIRIGTIKMFATDENELVAQALKEKGFIVQCTADGMYNEYGEFLDIFKRVENKNEIIFNKDFIENVINEYEIKWGKDSIHFIHIKEVLKDLEKRYCE